MQHVLAHQTAANLFTFPADDGPRLEFTGTLRADAQVRLKAVGPDCHMLPVLCMDIERVGPGQHAMRAEPAVIAPTFVTAKPSTPTR